MAQPITQFAVEIENEMPTSLRCVGKNVMDTADLQAEEVALFIERDAYSFFKKLSILKPEYSVSVVKHDGLIQIRVNISILFQNAIPAVRQRLENILWSYNEQVFAQKNGRLYSLPPKFQYKLSIESRQSLNSEASQ